MARRELSRVAKTAKNTQSLDIARQGRASGK